MLDGLELQVTPFIEKMHNPQANIFVKNLPLDFSANDIDQIFSKYGPIVSTSIKLDNKNHSFGAAYV